MLAHSPSFHTETLLQDLDFKVQFAIDRAKASRREGAGVVPEGIFDTFPALAGFVEHPHELTPLFEHAFHQGLCWGTTRDMLAGHAREFFQDVADGVMARRSTRSDNDDEAAHMGQALLDTVVNEAFLTVFAKDMGPTFAEDAQEHDLASNTVLDRQGQRQVLRQLVGVVIHHALHHGSRCA